MITTTALILLYLVIGLRIWVIGINGLGGKDQYLILLSKEYKHPCILYYTALVIVVIFWPIIIIKGTHNK